MISTEELRALPVWATDLYDNAGTAERIGISYRRAKTIATRIGMTVQDITTLSSKFWDYHKQSKYYIYIYIYIYCPNITHVLDSGLMLI